MRKNNYRATQELIYDQYKGHDNEVDPNLIIGICASLEYQYMVDEAIRHQRPDSQLEYGSGSKIQRFEATNYYFSIRSN